MKLRADIAGKLLRVIANEIRHADEVDRRMRQRLARAYGADAAAADNGDAELLAFDDGLPGMAARNVVRAGVILPDGDALHRARSQVPSPA